MATFSIIDSKCIYDLPCIGYVSNTRCIVLMTFLIFDTMESVGRDYELYVTIPMIYLNTKIFTD